jgi:hypothetical protein
MGVVFSYLYQVLYFNSINKENSNYIIAKEIYVTNSLVIYFQRNYFLSHKIDEQIERYNEAGLIRRILTRYVDFTLLKTKTEDSKDPEKLSSDQLSAVFQIYFTGVLTSIMVFLVEKISGLKKSWTKKFHKQRPQKCIHPCKT